MEQSPRPASPAVVPTASPPGFDDRRAVAVLPFVNFSGDPEQEFFADARIFDADAPVPVLNCRVRASRAGPHCVTMRSGLFSREVQCGGGGHEPLAASF